MPERKEKAIFYSAYSHSKFPGCGMLLKQGVSLRLMYLIFDEDLHRKWGETHPAPDKVSSLHAGKELSTAE